MVLILYGSSFSGKAELHFSPKREMPSLYRSVSRQFIIYGTQKEVIPYVMRRADHLADRWNQFFQVAPISCQPIIIRLLDDPGRNLRDFEIKIFLDDVNHVKIQLDVLHLSKVRNEEFDRKIFYALTLQHAYASSSPLLGSEYPSPPHWLIEAVMQDLLDAEESVLARPEAATRGLTQNLDLKSFLVEQPGERDAISQAIYRIKASALFQALRELPRGGANMHALLSQPSAWDGTVSSLIQFFPQVGRDTHMLTTSWKKKLVRFTLARKRFPLRMDETIERLNTILFILLPEGMQAPKNEIGVSGAQIIPLLAARTQYRYYLHSKVQDLLSLSAFANPICRPLIEEYREIIEILLQYPRKNLKARIQAAENLRETLYKRCSDIQDYMNGVEMASSRDAFSFFEMILENDQRRRAEIWVSNAISRMLDATEAGHYR